MIGFLQTYIPIGGGSQSLDQVLAIGDRPYKEILTEADYNHDHGYYEYNLVAGDTNLALNVSNYPDGSPFGLSSKINLNENFPDNAECLIYCDRVIRIAATEHHAKIINFNNEFNCYDTQGNQILISIKRFGDNFIVNEIDAPINFEPEDNSNKVSEINIDDPNNDYYYPSVLGLINWNNNHKYKYNALVDSSSIAVYNDDTDGIIITRIDNGYYTIVGNELSIDTLLQAISRGTYGFIQYDYSGINYGEIDVFFYDNTGIPIDVFFQIIIN